MQELTKLRGEAPIYRSNKEAIQAFLLPDGRIELHIWENNRYIETNMEYSDLIPFAEWILKTFVAETPAYIANTPSETIQFTYRSKNKCEKCGMVSALENCCMPAR